MKNYLTIFFLLIVLLGCTQKATDADKASVEATIKGFYTALEKFDYNAMNSYLTPEFRFFEDGTAYANIDELVSDHLTLLWGMVLI